MMRRDDLAKAHDLLQRGRWFLSRLRHFEEQLDRPRPQLVRDEQPLSDEQLAHLYRCLKAEYQPSEL